jgi:glutamyl-tRNA(Gln) amidotransferase subunit E
MVVYEGDPEYCCLVETDEEPPSRLNPEAVEIGLTVATMLQSRPVDEIHVMRKIVIDGSNTTGFQRTCVVALGGRLGTGATTLGIEQISLEEDAARKTSEDPKTVGYRLDRLGIPLIEISTAPDMTTPESAEEAALEIGSVLKSTRRVKRGLGTIRQDLNVSIREGALVEIKGVQELELISKAVEYEVSRQLVLLRICDELRKRGATAADLDGFGVDCTEIFRGSKNKVIQASLKNGGVVKALRLRKFGQLLGRELCPNVRLGTEFSSYASFWGRVGGIFHTDELPAYGITAEEVAAVRKLSGALNDDAVVIVTGAQSNADDAIAAVIDRTKRTFEGVPEETRAAQSDGTTRYMRPRPGAARMYPETDVPSFPVTEELLAESRNKVPPPRQFVIKELQDVHGLSGKLAEQLADSEHLPLFLRLAGSKRVPAGFLASVLVEGLTSLRRDGVSVDNLDDVTIEGVFDAVGAGRAAKESSLDIMAWLAKNNSNQVNLALRELNLVMLDQQELERIIQRHVDLNRSVIAEQRERAFGLIMGRVMGEVRGRADSRVVSEMIKRKLEAARS